MSIPNYFNSLLVGINSTVEGNQTIGGNESVEGNETVEGNLIVDGNLTVAGSSAVNNFEIVSVLCTGNVSSYTKVLTLSHNLAANTLYSVFPSVYYGFAGQAGTYTAIQTSGAMRPIVITSKTNTNFTLTVETDTGSNFNIYIVCLVVYAYPANYPTSY